GLAILVRLVPYLIDSHRLRSYPGPLLAKFSDVWLGCVAYQGHPSEVVHDLHKKYGQSILRSAPVRRWLIGVSQGFFVRIAHNHISVALSEAQPVVYGHGNRALKSSFHDVLTTTSHGLFDVRNR
ncbi:hypothetical protein DFS33DRAFT_1224024, partial [Desarmillaria ectypa]